MEVDIRKVEKYFLENKEPKDLLKNINEMNKKDLHEIFKKSYLPKVKSKEEIMKGLKFKKSWKYPSTIGREFNPIDVLKPRVLGFWEQDRVNMPERSYERYPVSKAIKCYLPGRDFGYDEEVKDASEQYQKFLKDHKQKFDDYLQRPSKYTKIERFLPSVLEHRKPFSVKKSDFDNFTFPKHNAFMYENRFRLKK